MAKCYIFLNLNFSFFNNLTIVWWAELAWLNCLIWASVGGLQPAQAETNQPNFRNKISNLSSSHPESTGASPDPINPPGVDQEDPSTFITNSCLDKKVGKSRTKFLNSRFASFQLTPTIWSFGLFWAPVHKWAVPKNDRWRCPHQSGSKISVFSVSVCVIKKWFCAVSRMASGASLGNRSKTVLTNEVDYDQKKVRKDQILYIWKIF